MIKIEKLTKSYGKSSIFKDLDLNIDDGKIVSILGPSGSGKSTLLNMISGLDMDFKGDIVIDDKSLKGIGGGEKITNFRGENISFIFQNFNLIENLTVKENVDLVIDINDLDRNYTSDEIIKLVGLESKINESPFNLSGGEKQRVAIARAFVGKSKLLLADEPTGSLDSDNTKNISSLIKELNKKTGITVILITHDKGVAKIADKIYEIKDYNLKIKDV